jgi:hypothetical protein
VIGELLTKLRETRGEGLVLDRAALEALGSPSVIFRLGRPPPAKELVLELFSTAQGDRVRRGEEQTALQVPDGFVESIAVDPLAYRRRLITSGKGDEIEEIEIQGPASFRLVKEDQLWRIAEPQSVAADGAAVRNLAGKLAEMEVERFAARLAGPEHGLARPWATVTARFGVGAAEGEPREPGAALREMGLELGSRAPEGGRYARRAGGDPVVFVIDDEYFEYALSCPLVARDLLQLSPTDLVELGLKSGADKLQLVRTDDRWRTADGVEIEGETLSQLVTDLGAAKTIRAESFGPAPGGFESPTLVITAQTAAQRDAGSSEVITVGPASSRAEEQGYLARRRGLEITFVLPARLVDDLVGFIRKTASR